MDIGMDRTCDKCHQQFEFPWQLRRHVERKTSCVPDAIKSHLCVICGEGFASRQNLNRHVRQVCSATRSSDESSNDDEDTEIHVQLQQAHVALRAEHADLTAEHATLTAEHATLTAEHATLTVEHATMVAGHAALKAEHAALKSEHAALAAGYTAAAENAKLKARLAVVLAVDCDQPEEDLVDIPVSNREIIELTPPSRPWSTPWPKITSRQYEAACEYHIRVDGIKEPAKIEVITLHLMQVLHKQRETLKNERPNVITTAGGEIIRVWTGVRWERKGIGEIVRKLLGDADGAIDTLIKDREMATQYRLLAEHLRAGYLANIEHCVEVITTNRQVLGLIRWWADDRRKALYAAAQAY